MAGCPGIKSFLATPYTEFEVKFVPTGPGGAAGTPGPMLVDTDSQDCKANRNPHKGCIDFGKNKLGFMVFSIKGIPKGKKCADAGTNRVITKIELTATGDGGSNTAAKGDFSGTSALNPLPDWVMDDAFPKVKLDTGIVYSEADVNDGVTHVEVFNLNHNKFSDGIKSVWYRVTVTHCTDPVNKNWRSDPRVDNEGGTY